MKSESAVCKNCVFAVIYSYDRGAAQCHRFPSTIKKNNPDYDWCGEFKQVERYEND